MGLIEGIPYYIDLGLQFNIFQVWNMVYLLFSFFTIFCSPADHVLKTTFGFFDFRKKPPNDRSNILKEIFGF